MLHDVMLLCNATEHDTQKDSEKAFFRLLVRESRRGGFLSKRTKHLRSCGFGLVWSVLPKGIRIGLYSAYTSIEIDIPRKVGQ